MGGWVGRERLTEVGIKRDVESEVPPVHRGIEAAGGQVLGGTHGVGG